MKIAWSPSIENGSLTVGEKVMLSDVPSNVTLTPLGDQSAFFGASSAASSTSRLNFPLGVFKGYRFLSLYRFKMWWMIPGFGQSGSEVPAETQMLLQESRDCEDPLQKRFRVFYVLFLPLLDGQFRATLHGTLQNELQLSVESGDPNVKTSHVSEAVFMSSGDDPYKLIKNSFKILEKLKGTFNHLDTKMTPSHVDWFGWSTWDAFYTNVNPRGIEEGLKSFAAGGYSPKFLIIDDGWQDTTREFKEEGTPANEQTRIEIQQLYKLVYAWHTILGYWGGVLPTSEAMKKYDPKLVYPIKSNFGHVTCNAIECAEKYGIGLIDPSRIHEFFEDLHRYLASCGVDGVKVDVYNILEILRSGYGGRVALTRDFAEALEESVMKNFKWNNLICCMSQNTECIYSSKKSATARTSEDFMPNELTFQTLHVASVAFTSLLMGEIVIPDWDMFCTNQYAAEFHGAARAVGGCLVYVSDEPGKHNFDVIKKLVLPDGSILRAKHAGRPTRDCLFTDPVTDDESLLKIWNLNTFTGVIGVFNCQRAGTWPPIQGASYIPALDTNYTIVSGTVRGQDVDLLEEEVADESWDGDCVIHSFNTRSIVRLPHGMGFAVNLGTLEFDVFTVSPIRVFDWGLEFAPIGLVDMYNSGGAVESLQYEQRKSVVTVQVRGCGRFGAYSSRTPTSCRVNTEDDGVFSYDPEDGLLSVHLGEECSLKRIKIAYRV